MNLKLSKYHLLALSLLAGLLMSIAWPVGGFAPLSLVAFVPLLLVERYIADNRSLFSRGAVVLYSYPGFLLWNVLTTWWVWYASPAALAAFTLNAAFMSLTLGLFHVVRRNLFKSDFGYIALIMFWISFEYLHQEWDLTWPWLNMGNVFASFVEWVQWYEFTGSFGGTLWVWLCNIMAARILFAVQKKQSFKTYFSSRVLPFLLVLLVPLVFSLVRYANYEEKGQLVEVVAVQPNLDPYGAQYTNTQAQTLDLVLGLVRKEISEETDVVICPESTLQGRLWEDEMTYHFITDTLRRFLADYPDLSFVIGASTRRMLDTNETIEPEARVYWADSSRYYYSYNTAFHYRYDKPIEVYHKSKMVPGVERMPFKKLLGFIDNLAIDLGGTTGSLGLDKERGVFEAGKKGLVVAPVICYESVYSRYVSDYLSNGANLITVITNDGWWENTPGHKQHFDYARLRAIESRTSVARSANTGISGFINQRGDVLMKTDYWVEDVVKAKVYANPEQSFYTQRKDYIANLSMFFSSLLLLAFVSLKLRGPKS